MERKKILLRILPLVVFIILAIILFFLLSNKEEGDRVRVMINGEKEAEYSLDKDITVSLNGGTNTLIIKDGKARISEADCPDKICVSQGWVSRMGECITCLPNKLVVEVIKTSDTVDLVV